MTIKQATVITMLLTAIGVGIGAWALLSSKPAAPPAVSTVTQISAGDNSPNTNAVGDEIEEAEGSASVSQFSKGDYSPNINTVGGDVVINN